MLRALEGPTSPPGRWTDDPLPSYRHVPGLTPHPLKHPDGHSYNGSVWHGTALEAFEAEQWQQSRSYLLGVDLFNRTFLWEAHEAWEEVWNVVPRSSIPGRMIQGMIQVAAAILRLHMESPRGAEGNYRKASAHFDWVENELEQHGSAQPRYLGVDLPSWRHSVEEYLAGNDKRFPYLLLTEESA